MTNGKKRPRIPPGETLYAIGDIHGHLDLLARLMARISDDARHETGAKTLVFLGDYIDRGVHSREVIDFLIHGLPSGFRAVFLRGNHEEIMQRFLAGDLSVGGSWLSYGGAATLASYGVNPYRPHAAREMASLCTALADKVPDSHQALLAAMPLSYRRGDYYFVHAGVRPGVPLEAQIADDLLWIRDPFLSSTDDHGAVVVHGHSIVPEPDIKPNRIGIDTGAYATGHLTCLKLKDDARSFLMT